MFATRLIDKNTSRRAVRPATALIAFSLVAAASSLAAGQVIDWNNPSGGLWSDAANWNPINVPGAAAGESARIAIAGTYTVSSGTFL